mgnify:CR=1 FL=1
MEGMACHGEIAIVCIGFDEYVPRDEVRAYQAMENGASFFHASTKAIHLDEEVSQVRGEMG